MGLFPGTIRATMRAGVAAGHPATAEVGAEILADGGTAADAVVAMGLASCVAETVMSGLLAGCHAIVFDGSRVANLDGFAAVPAGGGDMLEVPVPFGDEIVVYEIGAASCAVPGPSGRARRALGAARAPPLEAARRARARALRERASRSPRCTTARSRCSRPSSPSSAARRSSRGTDGCSEAGELLEQPGLVECLEALAEEGAASVYRGSLAEALLAVDGSCSRPRSCATTGRRGSNPVLVEYRGRRIATRGGLSGVPELLPRLPAARRAVGDGARARARQRARDGGEGGEHTTNMVAVDGHGRACVLTHSLGVGAGVWIPGFDVQLNNLLGESDIAFGEPAPGDHLESRMAPALAFDADGLELAIGSAGATRLRTALSTVLGGILDEGLDAEEAVARPRLHPTPSSSTPSRAWTRRARGARGQGRTVRRWDRIHHYFGGVSCVGRAGAAGDPRRSGAAVVL